MIHAKVTPLVRSRGKDTTDLKVWVTEGDEEMVKNSRREEVTKMYKHFICDVTDMDTLLEEINKENLEISAMLYASDSAQVVTVCKEGRKGFLQSLKEAKAKDEETSKEE